MKITIPGTPIAKKRPRFYRRGKHVGTYNDQVTEEGLFLLSLREQWRREPISGPMFVRLHFFFCRPKSHYGTGRNAERLKSAAPRYPSKKAQDVDNLAKFAMDCMNGVVYCDDRQVVTLSAAKRYGDDEKTVIIIDPEDTY